MTETRDKRGELLVTAMGYIAAGNTAWLTITGLREIEVWRLIPDPASTSDSWAKRGFLAWLVLRGSAEDLGVPVIFIGDHLIEVRSGGDRPSWAPSLEGLR